MLCRALPVSFTEFAGNLVRILKQHVFSLPREEVAYSVMSSFMKDTLSRRLVFFTGKGGVGKSLVAWATALCAQRSGLRVAVVSWSPFDGSTKPPDLKTSGVRWHRLDALACFREYALRILRFQKVYGAIFEHAVLKAFIRAAPGFSDTVTGGKLWDLVERNEQDLLVVDLPASGHAVSFFRSPIGVCRVFALGFVHHEAKKIIELFRGQKTRVDIVTTPEELPVAESMELKGRLCELNLPLGFVHCNQRLPDLPMPERGWDERSRILVDDYQLRRHREEALVEELQKIELPILSLPHFSGSTQTQILESLSAILRTL
jgi:anion-transporting  ArsA/GET3 family ATPase